MSNDTSRTDQLLDLVVYAPIGLALEAKELIPKLADRGRGQVALTRLAGRVASEQGPSQVLRLLTEVVGALGSTLGGGDEATYDGGRRRNPGTSRELPIDRYDAMSAPDLLPYLEPLSNDELEDVLRYERAHRSRATVINRIRQLQG